jgi:hypothetical protein
MRSSGEIFADIERARRELEGAHQNLDSVFSRAASSYTTQPSGGRVISSGGQTGGSGGYYSQPVVAAGGAAAVVASPSAYAIGGLQYTTHQGRSTSPNSRVTSHAPIVIHSEQSVPIHGTFTTRIKPSETLVAPINYTPTPTTLGSRRVINTGIQPTNTIFSGPSTTTVHNGGDIQEMIFNTIEEYVEGRTKIVGEGGRQRISKMLLPPEVNLLFAQQRDVTNDFMAMLGDEKKTVLYDFKCRSKRTLMNSSGELSKSWTK